MLPRPHRRRKSLASLLATVVLLQLPLAITQAGQTDIPGPSGGQFGKSVTVLPNGNIVVVDPFYDFGLWTDAGAVYLYSGTNPTGAALTAIYGIEDDDRIGSGGITVLSNGDFVIFSPDHDEGSVDGGAVTWVSGTGASGFNLFVNGATSIVGLRPGDMSGARVVPLKNGNYVILSPNWNSGAAADVGAVTWCDGNVPTALAILDTNSLVGTSAGDQVGSNMVELASGNFVVNSRFWNGGRGATTWCSGTSPTVGEVSEVNSLVGSTSDDALENSVIPLSNGHYVVASPLWDNTSPPVPNAGAVTWCSGNGSTVGPVSSGNSLVGGSENDHAGSSVTALTNGNYVVCSRYWDNPSPATTDVGAVTWCNGTSGRVGTVTATNSLTGGTTSDEVGANGAVALANGNYVVCSPAWDNPSPAMTDVGAVTWGQGTAVRTGIVSSSNSLTGGRSGNQAGNGGVTALTNGNYVVCSPSWNADPPAPSQVGAATWCNGFAPFAGVVSAANSLVGSTTNDHVGESPAVALANGNYVVRSSQWNRPSPSAATWAGAVTWGNGTTGITGPVSTTNSLVGSTPSDFVGAGGVIALTNGHYIVGSDVWNQVGATAVGAVTWGNGTTGVAGPITTLNSLIGSTANDGLGAAGSMTAQANGNYVVRSPSWDDGVNFDAGAVTPGNGKTGTFGAVTSTNSVLGAVPGGGPLLSFHYNALGETLAVGQPAASFVRLSTRPTASVVLGSTFFTVNEEAGVVGIPITRLGGTEGLLAVRLSTSSAGGTATGGNGSSGDYVTITNQLVNFAPGQATRIVNVTIRNDSTASEANETFKVTLSSISGSVLGTPSNATVRIIDDDTLDDTEPVNAPAISTPAANSLTPLYAGATMTVTGTASDERGISLVEVQLNGGLWVPATFTSITGMSAAWTATILPNGGVNTVKARSRDTRGNPSPESVARAFRVSRPLFVVASGGTVTKGFAPSSFREVDKSVSITATATATPAPGTLFTGWTVSGPTLAQAGILATAVEKPSLTFIFREGMQLSANFVANPHTSAVAGTYNGLIQPSPTLPDRAPLLSDSGEDGSLSSNSTEGHFTGTLSTSGAFSGKIALDGLVLNVAGAFDHLGQARFGTTRTTTLIVTRTGKPSLMVDLQLLSGTPKRIVGSVVTRSLLNSAVESVSTIDSSRSHFTGTLAGAVVPDVYLTLPATVPLPPTPTGRTDGSFTVVLPRVDLVDQPARIISAGYTTQDLPQGHGVGTIKITKAGAVTLSGTLADGTGLSASGTLSEVLDTTFFAPLYSQKGFFSVRVQLNAALADSDLRPTGLTSALWARPTITTSHYYPHGWPEVIKVGLLGAKHAAKKDESSIYAPDDGLTTDYHGELLHPPDEEDGNVALHFTAGALTGPLAKSANVTITDGVTKVPENDPTFTLTLTRATGAVSGVFTHTDDTSISYKGVIYQKGDAAGAWGYFLTKQPTPIDYTGESGAVRIIGGPAP